jgi:predicted phosphodiesterase
MRIALISDIHANLEALRATLLDVAQLRVGHILCLGDIVGNGPDPKECLDIVRQYCDGIVAGNHERGVTDPDLAVNWSPLAKAGIEHARAQLTSADMAELERLPMSFTMGSEVLGVHDSPEPSEHGMNYLRTRSDAARAFRWVEHSIALIGHTHVPACFATVAEPEREVATEQVSAFQVARKLLGPGQQNRGAFVASAKFELPRFGRVIVNPGSVGQPRDGDARASYAILDLDEQTVEYRRVSYDLVRAQQRIEQSELPSAAAARLALGA